MAVLIVAPEGIERALLGRRLTRWGATSKSRTPGWRGAACGAALGRRHFDLAAGEDTPRLRGDGRRRHRAPHRSDHAAERPQLDDLRDAGFTGYLVKPVRAASLKARLIGGDGAFDAARPKARCPAQAESGSDARRSLAILVAEDNDINALLTRALLTRLGHRPSVASDGAAALEAWRTARETGEPFDLVLMDLHMPGMTASTRRAASARRGR
jgi:hypothetical protein